MLETNPASTSPRRTHSQAMRPSPLFIRSESDPNIVELPRPMSAAVMTWQTSSPRETEKVVSPITPTKARKFHTSLGRSHRTVTPTQKLEAEYHTPVKTRSKSPKNLVTPGTKSKSPKRSRKGPSKDELELETVLSFSKEPLDHIRSDSEISLGLAWPSELDSNRRSSITVMSQNGDYVINTYPQNQPQHDEENDFAMPSRRNVACVVGGTLIFLVLFVLFSLFMD